MIQWEHDREESISRLKIFFFIFRYREWIQGTTNPRKSSKYQRDRDQALKNCVNNYDKKKDILTYLKGVSVHTACNVVDV